MGRPRSSAPRQAALFRNNRSQAVRIPKEFELPGNKVLIHQDGQRLVIEPIEVSGLLSLLEGWELIPDPFPEVLDPPAVGVDIET